ncbi:TraM recognition domain-containing protein, partial [Patescibacteria group bacterium]|nr:TraM recognition domain-containing protein [Patescibacteria group bacterium]
MEHILNNCILSLLDFPGSTLLGVNRILTDKEYRKRVVSKIRDPIVKSFWTEEYARWEDRFRNEAIAPIQNKVGQFLSASVIRNIVAQVKSTINARQIMDEGKIFIMNLAKGRIGEDSSRILGGMLITSLQLAAMERVDVPEADRRDFYLYVDEFQNFASQSFANILSEARKYHLNLIIAHQFIEQLDEDYVRPAVFGNVGTIVTFRVGGKDAEFLEQEFTPQFVIEDMVSLGKYDIYLKLMINGVASAPFSARTLPPIGDATGNAEKVIRVSRERYAQPRKDIEDKIMRWAGFEPEGEESVVVAAAPARQASPAPSTVPSPQQAAAPARPVAPQAPAKPGITVFRPAPQPAPTPARKGKVSVVVKCSTCGKDTPVGFTPDPSRPFYCDDCFKKVKEERNKQRVAQPQPPMQP